MSEAHTPGVMHVVSIEDKGGEFVLRMGSGLHVALTVGGLSGDQEAQNALRMAACWNQFDGLPTESIESMPGTVKEMVMYYVATQSALCQAIMAMASSPDDEAVRAAAVAAAREHAPYFAMPETVGGVH